MASWRHASRNRLDGRFKILPRRATLVRVISVATMTRASLRLLEWTQKHTQAALVWILREKAGVHVRQQSVSLWVRGLSTPHASRMIAMQRLLGIEVEDWFRPVLPAAKKGHPLPLAGQLRRTKPGDKPPPPMATGTDD